jgi:penicillin amidase
MSPRLRRFLIGLLGVVLLIALIAAAFGVFTVRRAFPRTSGEIIAPGLNGPADIYRDAYGVPHIYAASHHDLFFAQGYIHAQDRFWQMDFWRHIGSGRLSEMLGDSPLETDVFLRTLGWARVVEQELETLDPTSLAILEAYAAGVNAYLADHQGSQLSLEYAVLALLNPDYQPEPWTPLHSLTWAKAMAWDLAGNMDQELERTWLLKHLAPEQVADLYPDYPADHPVIVPGLGTGALEPAGSSVAQALQDERLVGAIEALNGRLASLDALLGPSGPGVGSNSWAVSGDLTNTGMPLLANDPHLGIQMPSIWYEIGLHCAPKGPDCHLDVDGFSFAGTPGVVIGHNDRIAWGFTNVGPDVIDLFIEKINPDNPDQYEVNGEWVDMTKVQETIQVAGGEPVEISVRYTRHGPLIWDTPEGTEDFRSAVGLDLPPSFAIAIQWTALEPSRTFPALWKLDLAQNWDEFRAAAAEFDVPSQNFLYADVDGNIGYQTPGRIPIRAGGDGRLPVPGWTDEYEWTGYIPFDELPNSFNPPEGYIVTANNAVAGPGYPYLITADWSYGYRAQRIVDLIEGAPGPIDIPYIQEMQGDNMDLNAETLAPVLLSVPLDDPNLEEARAILADWDYQDDMESAPAALFNVFWKNLLAATFHDDLPEDLWPGGGDRYFEVMRRLVQEPASPWWDDQSTPENEGMEDIFRRAFASAVAEIQELQGGNASRWNWGELHTTSFRNATLGESGIAPIEALFNRGGFRTAGGAAIVNATTWTVLEPYSVIWLPSMRMIVDLGDLSSSLTMHTTGQSGHAYHPHYIDMADPWRLIQYHPMLWERAQIEAASSDHLRLTP